jgi:hypothetical protein
MINGSELPDPNEKLTGLGRRHAPDPRDKNYPLQARPFVTGLTYRRWGYPKVIDQGPTPKCVGYSARTLLNAGPIVNKKGPSADELYDGAQQNDEWPGTNYEGSSVRGSFKFLKSIGFIGEYQWAQSISDIVNYCLTIGPVNMGTDWYSELSNPDRWGYIQPEGSLDGGHAWVVGLVVDTKHKNPDGTKGRFRMQNTWGPGWGEAGRAWITFDHVEKLLHADGEAGAPTEILVK